MLRAAITQSLSKNQNQNQNQPAEPPAHLPLRFPDGGFAFGAAGLFLRGTGVRRAPLRQRVLLTLHQDLVLQVLRVQPKASPPSTTRTTCALPSGAGATHLRGRQGLGIPVPQRPGEQLLPQDGPQVARHHRLLLHRAVVLQGQDEGVGRCLQGATGDGGSDGGAPGLLLSSTMQANR